MKFLITGGFGFLGSNLANEVLRRKENLVIVDNYFRKGSEINEQWLKKQGNFDFFQCNIKDSVAIESIIKSERPDVIFHVAGQVAMTTSLENPEIDFDTNALGTFNLLNSVRKHSPHSIVVYSSTNKVYGDLEYLQYEEGPKRYTLPRYPNGLDESIHLDFRTPYGCSKGCADQYIKDWAKCYQLKTVVFRHSSIYGGRQFATYDQGWIGWFVRQAISTQLGTLKEPFTISGNGKQVRDVLHADDLINCYFSVIENIERAKGEVFNIGGGMENSLSLLELFQLLEEKLNITMKFTCLPFRASDQKVFVADTTKAHKIFNWGPKLNKQEGIDRMIDWTRKIQESVL